DFEKEGRTASESGTRTRVSQNVCSSRRGNEAATETGRDSASIGRERLADRQKTSTEKNCGSRYQKQSHRPAADLADSRIVGSTQGAATAEKSRAASAKIGNGRRDD